MSSLPPPSPRIVSAGFLAMCATASMSTPPLSVPSSPGPSFLPVTAPTKFPSNFFDWNSPDLSLAAGSGNLFIRRAKATQKVLAPKSMSNRRIMDLADLGVDLGEVKLGPKVRFDEDDADLSTPKTPTFDYVSEDETGEVHADLEKNGLGLGIFVPDDSEIHPKPESTILRSCLKGDLAHVSSNTPKTKRRVTFSTVNEVFYPEFYPTELEAKAEVLRQYEESELALCAFRKLTEDMAERRRRMHHAIDKPFGNIVHGLPTALSARATQSRRVCFAEDVLVSRYSASSMYAKPEQEIKSISPNGRSRIRHQAIEHDKNLPIGARLRQVSRRVSRSSLPQVGAMVNAWRNSMSSDRHYPTEPPTPKLRPVDKFDDMSPMDALPSPLNFNFTSPPNLALHSFDDKLI